MLRVAMWESMPTWNKSKHHLQNRDQSGFWRHVKLFLLRQPNQQLCSEETTTVVLPFGSWVIIARNSNGACTQILAYQSLHCLSHASFWGKSTWLEPRHVPLANLPNSLPSRQSSRAGGPTHTDSWGMPSEGLQVRQGVHVRYRCIQIK